MKFSIKKLLVLVFVVLFAFGVYQGQGLASEIIFERIIEEPVGMGVNYRMIQRLTERGWVTAHVLVVDLKNPYTEIKTLTPENLSQRESVLTMAQRSGALGAINGDFYATDIMSFPIGPTVKDGRFLKQPTLTETMGVFSITKSGQLHIDRWTYKGEAVNSQGGRVNISHINIATRSYNNGIILYTPEFGKELLSNVKDFNGVLIKVKDNEVIGIESTDGDLSIPIGGYVLFGINENASTLKDNFPLGSRVMLNFATTPNWHNISSAIGGGAILLKDGTIPAFTHNLTGRHPRSAVAFNNDNLFLVVVDGRIQSSIGMTQEELAKFLLEDLGAKNALNLDGGGSSTLVGTPLAIQQLEVLNGVPTARNVVNGLGIFQNTPMDPVLRHLFFKDKELTMAPGITYPIDIKGYNKYLKDLNIITSGITFNLSGIRGVFSEGSFTPSGPGVGKVKGVYKGISAEQRVKVIGEPIGIEITPMSRVLDFGSKLNLEVWVVDSNGFKASVPSGNITWVISEGIGSITEEGLFTAGTLASTGKITAQVGNLKGTAVVAIGYTEKALAGFEEEGITFIGFPMEVGGSFNRVSDRALAKEGSFSGQLSYDFSRGEGTRAAYMVFPNGGLEIPGNPSGLKLWVYGMGLGDPWLRSFILDGEGKRHTVDLVSKVDWIGWRELTVNLPSNLPRPLKLERIYAVETDPAKRYWGSLFIDNIRSIYPVNIPPFEASELKDRLEGITQKFDRTISVWDSTEEINNLFQAAVLSVKPSKLNKDSLVFGISPLNPSMAEGVKNKYIFKDGYDYFTDKGVTALFLKTSNRTILSSKGQWPWIFEQLKGPSKTFIIIADMAPWQFSNTLEGKLLMDTLADTYNAGKDVFFFYNGESSAQVSRDRGVRYISFNGIDGVSDFGTAMSAKFVRLYLEGDKVKGFEFKNIIE